MKSLLFTNIQLLKQITDFCFVWLWSVPLFSREGKTTPFVWEQHRSEMFWVYIQCCNSDTWKIEIFTISASFPAESSASFSGHHYRGSGFTDALPAYGFWKGGCRAWGQRRIGRMGWDGATMGGMHKEAVSSRYLMFREVSQARKQPIYKHICGPIWQIKYIFTWSIFHCWKGSMVLASLPMVGCSLKFLLALVGRAGDVLQVLMSSAPPRRSTAFLGVCNFQVISPEIGQNQSTHAGGLSWHFRGKSRHFEGNPRHSSWTQLTWIPLEFPSCDQCDQMSRVLKTRFFRQTSLV